MLNTVDFNDIDPGVCVTAVVDGPLRFILVINMNNYLIAELIAALCLPAQARNKVSFLEHYQLHFYVHTKKFIFFAIRADFFCTSSISFYLLMFSFWIFWCEKEKEKESGTKRCVAQVSDYLMLPFHKRNSFKTNVSSFWFEENGSDPGRHVFTLFYPNLFHIL